MRTPQYLRRDAIDYNTWAGAYGVQQLVQAAHDEFNDLVILDRGPWDAGCWLEYASKTGQSDARTTAAFFQNEQWTVRSDLHVVLVVDPNEAAKRERDTRLIEHHGFSSDTAGMQAMQRIYSDSFGSLRARKAEQCRHVGDLGAILIDTTDIDPKSVSLAVIEAIFAVLNAKLKHGESVFVFSNDWVRDRVKAYVPRVRGKKSEILEWLPEFVVSANRLPPDQRVVLATRIDEASRISTPLIVARAPNDEIRQVLWQLLEEAASR